MGKPDNQPAAEKNMIKPYKEEKPYDLALLDRRPDDLASLVEMNLLRRMRASSPYGASSDTLKPNFVRRKPYNLAALGNCTPFCHFVSVCVILVPRQVFSILMDIIERTPYRFHLRFVFKSLLIT